MEYGLDAKIKTATCARCDIKEDYDSEHSYRPTHWVLLDAKDRRVICPECLKQRKILYKQFLVDFLNNTDGIVQVQT